jgi:hypothetical protein
LAALAGVRSRQPLCRLPCRSVRTGQQKLELYAAPSTPEPVERPAWATLLAKITLSPVICELPAWRPPPMP